MAAVLAPYDPKQQRRKRFVAFSLVTHAFNVLCLALIVLQGWLAPAHLVAFAICAMAGVSTFYYVVHRGWNLQMRDPSLVFPQLVFGITLALFAAAKADPAPFALAPALAGLGAAALTEGFRRLGRRVAR